MRGTHSFGLSVYAGFPGYIDPNALRGGFTHMELDAIAAELRREETRLRTIVAAEGTRTVAGARATALVEYIGRAAREIERGLRHEARTA